MKNLLRKLLFSTTFAVVGSFSASAYTVAWTWNDYDVMVHDGVDISQFCSDQLATTIGSNCHGYAFWQVYGLPFPGTGNSWATEADVNGLISSGQLTHLGTTPNANATHVLYYDPIPAGQFFDPLSSSTTLIHSTIISQFNCFPYIGQDYVQGKNGMTPGLSLHKIDRYDPSTVPHYFSYTPNSGALIPLDYQPACPPSILTCAAIVVNPVTCNNGIDGEIGVLHSSGSGVSHSYSWSSGGNTPTISNLSAGAYTVTVTESPTNEVCVSNVTLNNPSLNVANVTTTNHNGSMCIQSPWGWSYGTGTATVNLSNVGTYGFQWNTHNQTSQTAINLCSGWHSVTVTNTGTGCVETYSCYVGNTFVKRGQTSGRQAQIYPNPSKGKFTVETDKVVMCQVIVIDASGRIILDQTSEDSYFNADISEYGSGVYIIKMVIADEIITERMIVE